VSLSNATWQRSIDLAGEIKQARAVIDECAGAVHEADRISLDRANERHQALLDERAQLAEQAHERRCHGLRRTPARNARYSASLTRAEAFTWGALGALVCLALAVVPIVLIWPE